MQLSRHQRFLDTTLLSACERGDAGLVYHILCRGGQVSTRDSATAATPLIKAVIGNNPDVVVVILIYCRMMDKDFLHMRDNQGFSAFHWALYRGYMKCASVLLFLEPDICIYTDDRGRSCEQIASLRNDPTCVIFLQKICPEMFLSTENRPTSSEFCIRDPCSANKSNGFGRRRRIQPILFPPDEESGPFGVIDEALSSENESPLSSDHPFTFRYTIQSLRMCSYIIWREFVSQIFQLREQSHLVLPFVICVCSMATASGISVALIIIWIISATSTGGSTLFSTDLSASIFCHPIMNLHVPCPGVLVTLALLLQAGAWMCLYNIILTTKQLSAANFEAISLPGESFDMYSKGLYDIAYYYSRYSMANGHERLSGHGEEEMCAKEDVSTTDSLLIAERSSHGIPRRQELRSNGKFVESGHHCPVEVCHLCRVLLPMRAGHCKEIDTCVLVYDHYCPFLRGCICGVNYHFFVGYLLLMFAAEMLFVVLVIAFFHQATSMCAAGNGVAASIATSPMSTPLPSAISSQWLYVSARVEYFFFTFVVYFMIWTVAMWIMNAVMLGYHLYLLHNGRTTREDMYRPDYLLPHSQFDRGGLYANLKSLFNHSDRNEWKNKI